MNLKSTLLVILIIYWCLPGYSQCGPNVPTFTVNLTGNPQGTWTSPSVIRNDNCCGTTFPDRCVKFEITLDPNATGITFNIISGAIPGGALFYQINCGPPTALGAPICLSGVGPHILTFCKPGTNDNIYQITSIPAAVGGTNVTVNDGCIDTLTASGFNPATATWNSIFPGTPGQYNNLLSCTTGCLNPIVTGSGSLPPYIDYVVCGQPAAQCNFQTVCDTVRVTFNPTLNVTIQPTNPTICFGQTSTTITAVGSGGTPPYSYLWNNVNPSQTIAVGVGTYNVQMSDASGCPPTYAQVTVTAFSVAITANAGPDQTKCSQNPLTTLNATVTGASGGVWSGGSGTFSPSNTTLSNVNYTPSAAEIAAGQATLVLTTTGNGTCPPASDTVKISILPFTGTVTPAVTNVSCFGLTNGSSTVSVSGGPSPYTYTWTTVPTQTTSTATGLGPGTYSVTIKDGIGCVFTTTVAITQPTPLAISNTVTNVSCNGGNNGSIITAVTGGTPGYTYSWAPGGQSTATASNLTAGVYTVTATDTKGCIITASYTVTQPAPLATVPSSTNVSCAGGSDGAAAVTVTGGTPAYTYSWSPAGGTSGNASGLAAGTYTLFVTDSKGCPITQTVTITQPTVLTATAASTNETCDYLNNGTATVTVSGGTTAYTYSWQPGGQTSAGITGQQAGTYTVIVTDAEGCQVVSFATITQPPTLTVSLINQTNVSCFGGSNGSVTASPAGGTAGYTYSWMPGGQTGATASNLQAGTYSLTVTDANGCTAQNTVTITQPTPLTVTATIGNVSCNAGSDGTITANPSGGTPGYTYVWLPGNQATQTVSGLTAGVYTVTATDALGCTITASYTVTQPTPLAVAITPTAVSCFGGSDGIATASVTGGTPAYSYTWSPTGGNAATASGLTMGTYTVLVSDAKGCALTQTVSITQPTALTASTSVTNETCNYLNNGSATVTATGATPAYTYTWQPGNLSGSSISNQASGTYTVTIKDAKGCLLTVTATITEPLPIVITFTNQVNVSCFGGNNGSISGSASGGTPNYTYSWMPGSLSGANISNLSAGTYTLTITDANTCVGSSTVTITQPAAPVAVTATATPNLCNGGTTGSATATATGGTSPYTYSWTPGGLTGQAVGGLAAGTYTATATDAMGCTQSNTVTVTQPAPIVINTGGVNSSCGNSNGSVSASASGGLGPFTYTWVPSGVTTQTLSNVPSGSYTVNVTDANGCPADTFVNINDNTGPAASIIGVTNVTCYGGSNGSATVAVVGGAGTITYTWSPSGGNGPVATGLPAGTYIVFVTDTNGCQALATTSPAITQPPPITIAVTTTAVSCFGGSNGSATASASGGTPGYTYTWLPGGTSGPGVNALAAGTYTVQVTDFNNCVQTQTFVITQPSASLAVTPGATPVSCNGGSNGTASSQATGGTSPYNYTWMPGALSGQNISNLPAGTYTISVTDNKGCATSNTVTVTQPPAITLTVGSGNSTCGNSNGTASVTATGGTPSYNYTWSPSGGNNNTAGGLLAGTYTVAVTDLNGCPAAASVTVSNTPGPTVTVASVTNVSCNLGSNGSATANVAGGTGAITYTWSPTGGNNQTGTGMVAGSYTVIIQDANGCQAVATTTVTQPPPIAIAVTTSNTSCFAGTNGSASALASGGTPGFTYLWLPGNTTGTTVNGLAAGTYTVRATDANGCVQTQTFVIAEPAPLTASISATSNVSCFGGNNGTASAAVGGGTPFYNYAWAPLGGNGPTGTGLPAGNYTVNITDSKGCTTFTTVTITQPTLALSGTSSANGASCFGGSNGTATVTVVGGTPGYNYQWQPTGGNLPSASGLTAGNYVVLVSDANGCATNVAVTISQGTPITGTLVVTNPSCGFNNGAIVSQISGGTSPYGYSWSPGGATGANLTGAGPGTYTLLVTDGVNCTQTFSTALVNIPGPAVSVIATTSVSCFGGNNGAATISIAQGTTPYTISWSPFGGNAVTAGSLIAGTYTATVTDSLGCIATAVANIFQPTQVQLAVASQTDVSCNGGNDGAVTVQASGGNPGYVYTWNPSVSATATATSLLAGTYTATATDANGCPTSITIIINQPNVLTSTISAVSNAVCFNGTGNAAVSVSGGTAPYSYTWSTNPVQTGSTASNILAGTYTVSIVDSKGCTTQNTVTITQPAMVVTTVGVNDTVCKGQTGTLTASATGGSGGYYYAWQPSGTINAGTYTVSANATTIYTVVAYDQFGCAGNPDTAAIVVYTLPPSAVTVHGITPICPGTSSTIYVSTTGVTGPLTYSWNNNLGNSPGAFLVTPSQPTTYIVTVTSACGEAVTDSIFIDFNPQPTISIGSDDNTICVPDAVQFTDFSASGNPNDPITSWYWTFGDGTSLSQSAPNPGPPSHLYTSPGTYTVTLTVGTNGGCTSTNASAPYIVNAYPYPVAAFSINSTTLSIPYDSLKCTNQSIGASSYQWFFGDGATSTLTHPGHMYTSVGIFQIQLVATTQYGCSDTAYAEVTTTTNITFPNAFTPNADGPNGGSYTFGDLTNDVFFPYTSGVIDFKMQIFNRWGELIFESLDIKQGWDGYYRGKLCQQDVYVWKAFIKFNNGKTFNKSGDVTLLR
jgi:large repetitive protein